MIHWRASVLLTVVMGVATSTVASEAGPLADLGSPDAASREAARAEILTGGAEILPALATLLADGATVEACEAARLMGEIGSPVAREALRQAIEESEELPVRRAALLALARVGDFRDVEILAAALGPLPGTAARALGILGEAKGIEALVALVDGGRVSGSARTEALASLVRLGRTERTADLIAHLGARDAQRVRALTRLREVTGADAGADQASWEAWWGLERLAASLSSREPVASKSAVDGLLATAGPDREKVLPSLIALAEDVSRPAIVRCRAILTLGLMGDRQAVAPILAIFEGPGGQVRSYAAEALGRLGDVRAVIPLVLQLVDVEDPDREMARRINNGTGPYYIVDVESCKSLVRFGLAGGLRVSIETLFGEWRTRMYNESLLLLRQTTGREFGFCPDASAEDRAAAGREWVRWFRANRFGLDLPAACDPDDPVLAAEIDRLVATLGVYKFLTSDTAKRALMVLGEPARGRLERAAVEDPNTFVRAHAAEILGELGHPASVVALAKAARTDTETMPRAAAVEAIGRLGPAGGEAAVSALRAVLLRSDETQDVRTAAVEALGLVSDDTRDADLLADLLRVSVSAPAEFRLASVRAMARVGDPAGLDGLLPFLEAEEPVHRREAVEVLRETTGHDLGYEPEGSLEDRAAAIERWRERVAASRTVLPRAARGYVRVTYLTPR